MKVFYIPKTCLGEFFYDPASQRGVGISEGGILQVTMSQGYDPRIHRDYRECEVPEDIFDIFSRLSDSASKYTAAKRDVTEALRHFPRPETHCLSD
mgnify:CR=1 FL=1